MNKFFLVAVVGLLFSSGANAGQIFSCEAERLSGNGETFDRNFYPRILPTIILNLGNETLIHVYSEHGRQWKSEFQITKNDGSNLVGIAKFMASWVKIIHFNLEDRTYSIFYAGDTGNTLEYGNCLTNS